MQSKNKIYMILTNGFDPDVRVYKEAKYLVDKNFEVEILCWDRKCEYLDRQKEVQSGIKITRFSIQSEPGSGLKQIFPYMKFLIKVRKYLKSKEYKYLHCHDFDGILIGMFTKRRKQKKVIFDMHEIYNDYAYAKNIFFSKIFHKVIKKCNYIIYVNEEQSKEIEREKLIFLPNYPEKNLYSPIEKTNNGKKLRINYVGSVRDYEAIKSLLEVKKDEIEVGIYGIGVAYNKLKNEYKNNLYGEYNGITEIGEIYRNTDILYCSYNPDIKNWKKAYPVKLYEAIITITPVIVSKNTSAGELVQDNKIGEVIEYSNVNSISNAIDKIIDNYNEYVNNIKFISDRYKWEDVVKNLDKIYLGVEMD